MSEFEVNYEKLKEQYTQLTREFEKYKVETNARHQEDLNKVEETHNEVLSQMRTQFASQMEESGISKSFNSFLNYST